MCDLTEGQERMEFYRKGPEGGVEIYSSIRNGKAFLECKIHLQKTRAEELLEEVEGITEIGAVTGIGDSAFCRNKGHLDIRVWDHEENLVLHCRHPLDQEELAEGILLHPHLWQGVADPYLYRIQISLIEKENCVTDSLEDYFALRDFREMAGKGWVLNDAPFSLRPVAYQIPVPLARGEEVRTQIYRDLEWIRDMGANAVCPIESKINREFCRMCDELGLVVWWTDGRTEIPAFYDGPKALFSPQSRLPANRYYYYKALWSSDPFVYINADSLCLQKNGNAEVTVYSNQKKVALYVEGVLFEFQVEGPEFRFQEIPIKRLPLQLSAEAGEYSMSVTAFPKRETTTE